MAENSVIGSSTVVSGHLHGQGSLEILGRVEGDVSVTGAVVVGPSGRVRGNISAAELTVSGQVQGDLRGTQAVHVERGARIVGDIESPRIGIAPGALVRGHVQTDGEAPLGNAAHASRPGAARAGAPVAVRVVSPPTGAARGPAPQLPASAVKSAQPPEPRKFERPAASVAVEAESAPVRAIKAEPRRPPPPVVPVISKGTKAKKRKGRD